jgi:hypothetical protein
MHKKSPTGLHNHLSVTDALYTKFGPALGTVPHIQRIMKFTILVKAYLLILHVNIHSVSICNINSNINSINLIKKMFLDVLHIKIMYKVWLHSGGRTSTLKIINFMHLVFQYKCTVLKKNIFENWTLFGSVKSTFTTPRNL